MALFQHMNRESNFRTAWRCQRIQKEQTVDYSEVIREMKMNRIICYEKKLDWESAKAAITQYTVEYPDDIAAQKEAEFLSTR